MRPGRAAYRALEQSLTSDNSYLSGMGNAINGTVNHQVGETIKGDAPSPIIKAIQAGQLSKRLLKALLAEGANVNYSSQIYGTPLMTACSHGPLSVVELLLRHGADPNNRIPTCTRYSTPSRPRRASASARTGGSESRST